MISTGSPGQSSLQGTGNAHCQHNSQELKEEADVQMANRINGKPKPGKPKPGIHQQQGAVIAEKELSKDELRALYKSVLANLRHTVDSKERIGSRMEGSRAKAHPPFTSSKRKRDHTVAGHAANSGSKPPSPFSSASSSKWRQHLWPGSNRKTGTLSGLTVTGHIPVGAGALKPISFAGKSAASPPSDSNNSKTSASRTTTCSTSASHIPASHSSASPAVKRRRSTNSPSSMQSFSAKRIVSAESLSADVVIADAQTMKSLTVSSLAAVTPARPATAKHRPWWPLHHLSQVAASAKHSSAPDTNSRSPASEPVALVKKSTFLKRQPGYVVGHSRASIGPSRLPVRHAGSPARPRRSSARRSMSFDRQSGSSERQGSSPERQQRSPMLDHGSSHSRQHYKPKRHRGGRMRRARAARFRLRNGLQQNVPHREKECFQRGLEAQQGAPAGSPYLAMIMQLMTK